MHSRYRKEDFGTIKHKVLRYEPEHVNGTRMSHFHREENLEQLTFMNNYMVHLICQLSLRLSKNDVERKGCKIRLALQ